MIRLLRKAFWHQFQLVDRFKSGTELVVDIQYITIVPVFNGIFDLILETVLCRNNEIVVASNKYPAELVRSKFLKLTSSHSEYAIGCMKSNTTKVHNIKKYLLATLFNAPSTISGYYQAEVNHDYPQFAVSGK